MKTIQEGSTAPDFELPDEDGNPVRLSERLKDGPVVLFFYPGALTGGCTQEACRFRDLSAEFKALGAQPLGISADAVAKQKEFSEVNSFDYPLLSDEDREVASGVRRQAEVPHPGQAGHLRDRRGPDDQEGHRHRDEDGDPRRRGARRAQVTDRLGFVLLGRCSTLDPCASSTTPRPATT